jgi:hypothetical protein
MSEKSTLQKLGVVLWRVVPLVVVIGILCVWLAPDDFKKVKKLGFILIYWAGLPFLLGSFVLYSEKKGWLK